LEDDFSSAEKPAQKNMRIMEIHMPGERKCG